MADIVAAACSPLARPVAYSASGTCTVAAGSSKYDMPCVGFGTYELKDEAATTAVKAAVEAGYRHIDSATVYRNGAAVAAGWQAAGVDREQLWITTKISPRELGDKLTRALEGSAAELAGGTVDLTLLHWPGAAKVAPDADVLAEKRVDSWRRLELAVDAGVTKSIGVSNFMPWHLQTILDAPETAGILPAVNQIELHPLCQQREAVQACMDHGIVVQAYSPLARADEALLQCPAVQSIAETQHASPAAVCLAWSLARGHVVLPKAASSAHIRANAPSALQAVELTAEQLATLDGLNQEKHVCWDPRNILK